MDKKVKSLIKLIDPKNKIFKSKIFKENKK